MSFIHHRQHHLFIIFFITLLVNHYFQFYHKFFVALFSVQIFAYVMTLAVFLLTMHYLEYVTEFCKDDTLV